MLPSHHPMLPSHHPMLPSYHPMLPSAHPHPESLQESLLASIGAVVGSSGASDGLARLLSVLSPIFRPLPAMADKFVLLLWEVLALPHAPRSAHDALQAALVEHYRGGSTEMLQQGLRLAALPLLALCGREGASNRVKPSDAPEATTPPTFGAAGSSLGGGVGSSLVVPGDPPAAAELHVADLPLPKGLVAKGASKEGARLPEVALKLPARTAMRLIMELGAPPAEASGVVVPGSSALLSQLESKLHLLQVAHALVQLPYSDGPAAEAALAAGKPPAELLERLAMWGFLASELRKEIGKTALEVVCGTLQHPLEREALLLWLPAVLGSLSHEALAYAFLEQMVHAFRWESLTPPLYLAFEALFRHYHLTKGHVRYEAAPSEGGGGGGSFSLFKLLSKKGRTAQARPMLPSYHPPHRAGRRRRHAPRALARTLAPTPTPQPQPQPQPQPRPASQPRP